MDGGRRSSRLPPRPAGAASFETEKRVGVFTGHVRVFDPRFNLQSDKLTVFIHKEEGEGLEKAIAVLQILKVAREVQ